MLATLLISAILGLSQPPVVPVVEEGIKGYVPSAAVVAAKEQFRDDKFGVFITGVSIPCWPRENG